ncbi:hypothetical protein KIN20_029564 [Parelaphostrongylus tenuis]|uniref:Uncharacterized protein n=1 Tax=Parelaphostrongylus tenuis TaxID=148309 RepID=A0AAD5R2U3_PARTN|nr:hypothetical protein KIN20_029564 [Parelaphostrongylus tenuis]
MNNASNFSRTGLMNHRCYTQRRFIHSQDNSKKRSHIEDNIASSFLQSRINVFFNDRTIADTPRRHRRAPHVPSISVFIIVIQNDSNHCSQTHLILQPLCQMG